MGQTIQIITAFFALLFLATPTWPASTYGTAAANATTWLLQQQNVSDGSWGASDDVKYVRTSEAVLALAALNRRTVQYYAGITWLQNHVPANVDYSARRVLALQSNGNSVAADLLSLQGSQALAAPGNSGWGLSKLYQGSALDTALALQAYNQAGVTTNVANAVSYLTGTQLSGTDKGWVVAQESSSDPVSTAHVLIALIPLKASYASLPTAITNGLATLNTKVTTTSPASQKALSVIANLRNSAASPQAVTLLNNLVATQSVGGSWGSDTYVTALAMRALAAGLARDLAAQQQAVNMPDAALRAAINQALGRSSLDALNVGELSQLTTLNIAGLGITNLTGIQNAINLTYLDARNNNISDFSPVAGLTSATILEDGNPGYAGSGGNSGDVPTLPEWGAILLASLFMMAILRQQRNV